MNDLQQLEAELEANGGSDAGPAALPPGFREKLQALKADGVDYILISTERTTHIENARRLIDQLGSADNLVVQTSKKRVIRAELNAVKLLDEMQ